MGAGQSLASVVVSSAKVAQQVAPVVSVKHENRAAGKNVPFAKNKNSLARVAGK